MELRKKRVRTELLPADGLGVGVETEEDTLVAEGVLVLRPGTLLDLGVGGTDDGLDLSAVDQPGDVGVGDLGGGEASESKRCEAISTDRKAGGGRRRKEGRETETHK